MNAYLLTLGSLILIGGSLGDIYGERRIFSLGVAGFGVASLLCAVAPTIETLVAARALQGVASALLTPASLAVIVTTFDDEGERGAAIGTWTAWGGIAAVLGPVAGGWIVDVASWRWIFAVNVPFVLVTLVLIRISVPGSEPAAAGRRVDYVGGALCALGLAGPVFALTEQPARGWSDPVVVAGPRRRRAPARAVRALRVPRESSDAAAAPVRTPELQRREPRDAARLRGALGALLLPHDLPAAGRRLVRARERPRRGAGDGDHVRALAALRRAGRPPGPAPLHGGRPARRRRGRAPARPTRRGRRATWSTCSRRCSSSGSASRSPSRR